MALTLVVSEDVSAHRGRCCDGSAHSGSSRLTLFKGSQSLKDPDLEREPCTDWQANEPSHMDISKGSWAAAGYHLATTIATPAAYAYLPYAFAGLGWGPGMVALLMGIAVTWYTSVLLASLHKHNGQRHTRYSTLASSISGRWAGRAVVFFQQVASLGNNITLGIVAGISMKSLHYSFYPESSMTLQSFIAIFGGIQLLLSQLPSIHDLRLLNLVCTLCTCGFAVTATALSIHAGHTRPEDSPPPDFSVFATGPFAAFSALGTVAFAFGDTVLPEVQATLREPVERSMYRGIALCYAIISTGYLLVTVSGYWAFGNAVQPYLPASFLGPKWAVRATEFFALIQILGCYQIYCRPTYEVLEGWALDANQGALAPRNMAGRLAMTTVYCSTLTLIGCAMPFFGSFLALCGAIGFTPLDFILPLILYNQVHTRSIPTPLRWLHLSLAALYMVVGVVAAVGAVHFIVRDCVHFSLFADLPVS